MRKTMVTAKLCHWKSVKLMILSCRLLPPRKCLLTFPIFCPQAAGFRSLLATHYRLLLEGSCLPPPKHSSKMKPAPSGSVGVSVSTNDSTSLDTTKMHQYSDITWCQQILSTSLFRQHSFQIFSVCWRYTCIDVQPYTAFFVTMALSRTRCETFGLKARKLCQAAPRKHCSHLQSLFPLTTNLKRSFGWSKLTHCYVLLMFVNHDCRINESLKPYEQTRGPGSGKFAKCQSIWTRPSLLLFCDSHFIKKYSAENRVVVIVIIEVKCFPIAAIP